MREPHVFKDQPKTEAPRAPLGIKQGVLVPATGTGKPAETGATSAVASAPFDRKAYQREYMKAYRLRKKADGRS